MMKSKLNNIESAIGVAARVLVKIGNMAITLAWGCFCFMVSAVLITILVDFAVGLVPGFFPAMIVSALKAILLLAIAFAVVNDFMEPEA